MMIIKTKRCDVLIINRHNYDGYSYDGDVYVRLVRHEMPKRMFVCISSYSKIVVVMLHGSDCSVSSLNAVAALHES